MCICESWTQEPVSAHFGSAPLFLVVGGIGFGALSKVQAAGVPVYFAEPSTVREALTAGRGRDADPTGQPGARPLRRAPMSWGPFGPPEITGASLNASRPACAPGPDPPARIG